MKPNEAVRSRDDATTDVTYANMRVNNVGETDTSETYDTLDFRGSGRKSWATPKSAPTDYGAELRRLKLIITILAILFTITTITTLSVLISQVTETKRTKKEAEDIRVDVDALKHASTANQESNKTLHEEIEALQISLKHNKADIDKLIDDVTPVNGSWGNWTYISECSLSCGGGKRHRMRMCDSPRPRFGGNWCSGNDMEILPCNTEVCPDFKSAFTVSGPTRDGSTIRFNNVITNLGSHYNTASGQFICHYPGIYVFSLHMFIDMGAHTYIIAYCYIRKNGSNQIRTRAKSEGSTVHSYYESSTSVVLHLKLNDKVDIGGCYKFQYISSDSLTTSFSGFLVQAD